MATAHTHPKAHTHEHKHHIGLIRQGAKGLVIGGKWVKKVVW